MRRDDEDSPNRFPLAARKALSKKKIRTSRFFFPLSFSLNLFSSLSLSLSSFFSKNSKQQQSSETTYLLQQQWTASIRASKT